MSLSNTTTSPLRHADRFFIGGEWVAPSLGCHHRRDRFGNRGALLQRGRGPGSRHGEGRRRGPPGVRRRSLASDDPRPAGGVSAQPGCRAGSPGRRHRADLAARVRSAPPDRPRRGEGAAGTFDFYAGLADTFEWEQEAQPSRPGFGLLVREPVGVVGAIIPWNGPLGLISYKIAPALIAGCTVILKSSPEAPGEGYLVAEVAEEIGMPPGVLNVVTADRQVSELLVRDPRVDKITFTGSTAAGRRIASLCGERIARCTLELGGKSAAVVLDDADLGLTAARLAQAECMLTGQVCSSLTRIVVTQHRHDELVEALVGAFSQVRVGNQFDPDSQMGPLAVRRQRDRVLGYIEKGVAEGATLATGGGRPAHLEKGWFVEPTVFANVENSRRSPGRRSSVPVLSVIPAKDERDAVAIANDTIYGLNASVFTDRRRPGPGGRRRSCAPAPSGTIRSVPTSASPSVASSSRASVARVEPRVCSRSSRPRRSSWRSARPPMPGDDGAMDGPSWVQNQSREGRSPSTTLGSVCPTSNAPGASTRACSDSATGGSWTCPMPGAVALLQLPAAGGSHGGLPGQRAAFVHRSSSLSPTPGSSPTPRRVMNDLGLTHLSVAVDDIAATLEKVGTHGGEILEDTDMGGRAIMIRDPDGQLIELTTFGFRAMRPPWPDPSTL